MRRVSLCLAFPFVLACGPSGIVGIDNIRGPTGPDTPRETVVPLTIRVEGVVTAADDGSPIAGALVEFMYLEPTSIISGTWHTVARSTTDAQGHYSLSYVKEGFCGDSLFSLVVNAQGFAGEFVSFVHDLHITCTEELQIIDIQLHQ